MQPVPKNASRGASVGFFGTGCIRTRLSLRIPCVRFMELEGDHVQEVPASSAAEGAPL